MNLRTREEMPSAFLDLRGLPSMSTSAGLEEVSDIRGPTPFADVMQTTPIRFARPRDTV